MAELVLHKRGNDRADDPETVITATKITSCTWVKPYSSASLLAKKITTLIPVP
jgi:hypothetical protein